VIEANCAESSAVAPLQSRTAPSLPDWRLPGLDGVEHECWSQFAEAATRIGAVLQRMLICEHNLTLADLMLLGILAKSDDGSARMGDLADALVLIPSRVTQLAGRLEAQGLLTRSASKNDRRGVIATITHDGRVRLKPALRTYAGIVRTHYLVPLSRQQMTAIGDSCRRVSGGLIQNGRPPKSERR
jgi:DNA-binding MarR family transcriptional regulator